MNSFDLSQAMTNIRTEYILESADLPGSPLRTASRRRPRLRRLVTVAAALALCLTAAVPALADHVDVVYQAIYAVSPALAQSMKSVELSCEDSGIRMEVLAADVEGSRACVYLSLQDTTGDRVDETTDLFDSYDLNAPYDCAATCTQLEYDGETGTATFLVTIDLMDGETFQGDRFTFSLSRFLSHKNEWEGPLPLALSQADDDPATQSGVSDRGGTGSYQTFLNKGLILDGGGDCLYATGDGAAVTAVGYLDGQLHVQVLYDDILSTDSHGDLWLVDGDGQEIACAASFSFWVEDGRSAYVEYVFDLGPEEAEGCTLYGYFVTGAQLTQGNWEVTFQL
ncbi:MAG: hypothetical protein LIO45_06975 [Clostridiales bacterium]|nr:hypothetical protein [Clostridiales bacterium]